MKRAGNTNKLRELNLKEEWEHAVKQVKEIIEDRIQRANLKDKSTQVQYCGSDLSIEKN